MRKCTSVMPLVAASIFSIPCFAQVQQKVSPPVAQFWLDAATNSMSMPGMDEMEDNPALGGMMGNMFGNSRHGMSMPGKYLDSALHTRKKPGGTVGQHGIPEVMAMGPYLTLIPFVAEKGKSVATEESVDLEKPKGRMMFYWGCSETVREGQPRLIDFSTATPADYAKFMTGRHAPDRGAKAVPGRSVWPNRDHSQRVPKQASLVGGHSVAGEGVPAPWQFSVGGQHDFMARLRMTAVGPIADSVPVTWDGVETATGYFLTAMSGRETKDGVPEMVLWSSSNDPDPGWGLMDYLTPGRVDQLVKEKVVLPREARKCPVPKGIFAGTEGAMVRMIAYGPEMNMAYPPRPADPKVEWKPDWSVLLRLKSTSMTMLGGEPAEERPSRRASDVSAPAQDSGARAPDPTDALKEIANPVNLLKGLFGR